MSSMSIIASGNGLKAGEELTFFYPSTEWDMAQGFDCFCGSVSCRGFIRGAKSMSLEQLQGMWLNAHIRKLLEERDNSPNGTHAVVNELACKGESERNAIITELPLVDGNLSENCSLKAGAGDATEDALKSSLQQARKMVDAAQKALNTYKSIHGQNGDTVAKNGEWRVRVNGVGSRELSGEMGGDTRHGVTSRELSGEMGGDTVIKV